MTTYVIHTQKIEHNYRDRPDVRCVAIGFRATRAEAEELKLRAHRRGMSVGEYCRTAALDLPLPDYLPPLPPPLSSDAVTELRSTRLAFQQLITVVNQLRQGAKAGAENPKFQEILDQLAEGSKALAGRISGIVGNPQPLTGDDRAKIESLVRISPAAVTASKNPNKSDLTGREVNPPGGGSPPAQPEGV